MPAGLAVVAAGHHLDRPAAALLELADQASEFAGAEPVARRMRDHGDAAGVAQPAHRGVERRPAAGHVPGLAARQEMLERVLEVARMSLLHQEAREVRARKNRAVRVARAPFQGAEDALPCEPPVDLLRAPVAELAQPGEPLLQRRQRRVDVEADDVHGLVLPGDGHLHAGDQRHAERAGLRRRLGQAVGHVVVGERQHRHAARVRALHEFGRAQGAVRVQAVGVQVVTRGLGWRNRVHGRHDSRLAAVLAAAGAEMPQ